MQCNICGSHLEEKVKICPYCEADISSQFIDEFKHSKTANDLLGTGDYIGQGDLNNEGKTKPDMLSVEEAENNRKIEVETKRYRYVDPSFINAVRSKLIKDQVELYHPIKVILSDVDAEKLLVTGGFQDFDLFNGKVLLKVNEEQLGLLYWLGFEDLTSKLINALPEVFSKKENLHYWHLYLNGKTEESITTYYKTDRSKRIEPNHLFFAYCCLHDESEVLSILDGMSDLYSNYYYGNYSGLNLPAAWFFGVVLHNIKKSKDLLSKELPSWNSPIKYFETANVRKLVFNDSDYIKQIFDLDNTDNYRWDLRVGGWEFLSCIRKGLSEVTLPIIENIEKLYVRIFPNDNPHGFPYERFKLSSVFILSEDEIQQRIEIQEISERIDIEAECELDERNGYDRDETALIQHYIEYAKQWKNLLNHNEKAISCLKKAEVILNRSTYSILTEELIEIANIWQLNFEEQPAYERAMELARGIADSSNDYHRLAEEYCRLNNAFRNELVGKEYALIAEEKAKYLDDFIFLARFWFLSFQDMNKVNECFMKAESFITREQDEYYLNQQKEIFNTSNYFKIY